MGIRLGVVLALPLALLASCGESGNASTPTGRTVPDLDGTSWITTSITEGGRPRAVVPGSEIRVDFDEGRIDVNAGCNHMSGPYSLSADAALAAGPLSSTEMGCAQALMDQDAWVSGTAFASPLLAVVDDEDTLTLSRDGLEMVLADRAVTSPDVLLEGTDWELDGIGSGGTASSVPAGQQVPTLTISSDGAVTVHTGCNRGRSSATVSGSTITFGPVATTKMACADGAAKTEAAVLAVLDGAVEWSISEKTLTLTKGDQALTYRAAS